MSYAGPIADIAAQRRRAAVAAELETERSRQLVRALDMRMEPVILAWLGAFAAGAALRIALTPLPIRGPLDFAEISLPYALAALAPVAGYCLAIAAFPVGALCGQSSFSLALYGRWRRFDPFDPFAARPHPAFGPFGLMSSLLVGLLLNVPVRSFESCSRCLR